MKLSDIVKFLNKELKISKIKDASRNGLQVYGGMNEIRKIGVAVDACMDVAKKAKEENVDLIIVHHGIKWIGQKHQHHKKAVEEFLRKNKISLYAAHLPLDLHSEYGNNIQLCNLLGLRNIKPFGNYHGASLGYRGEFAKPLPAESFVKLIEDKLKTKCQAYMFGKNKIKTVGVISGGGNFGMAEAASKNLDAFFTGEAKLSSYHFAKDLKLNYVCGGHYTTETFGVNELGKLLQERFKLETVFIENDVGL
ncbi:MAG: Nif3-like dinuclear metal center hexameric protein [Nanoarchaeota archaeon]|nr:Nif3-like dinuclear metal center hexameric protein [Nanoarchaeota archaeon]